MFNRILQSIGPSSNISIDWAQSLYCRGACESRIDGSHRLVLEPELLRMQVNGFESNNHRGIFSFRVDFGRSAVANRPAGAPSQYRLAIGSAHRGLRNRSVLSYIKDDWRISSHMTL